jgi:polyhydroxybutyrate depolymerase
MLCHLCLLLSLLVTLSVCHAQLPQGVHQLSTQVDGVTRTGLVYAPATAKRTPAPVVFIFHGHGGSALQVGRSIPLFKLWPEAISVYLQGLNTANKLVDPEGVKSGWQANVGENGDRDLKFFDAVLSDLKEQYKVDTSHIFITGHSNGGAFTYLLWQARPEVICAIAPSAAASLRLKDMPFKPRPCMHIAGSADTLVKYQWQVLTMNKVRQIDGCSPEGQPWAKNATLYPSATGTPVVTLIHPGDHKFPEEAPPLIVRFFKEQIGSTR